VYGRVPEDQLGICHLIPGNHTAMQIDQSMQSLCQASKALFQKKVNMTGFWKSWLEMASDNLALLALDSLLTGKDLNHSIARFMLDSKSYHILRTATKTSNNFLLTNSKLSHNKACKYN
jgi:hypothetical protein